MKKAILGFTIVAVLSGLTASAEPIRTLFTKENKFPLVGQSEAGLLLNLTEFQDNSESTIFTDADRFLTTAYYRYGVTEDFAVRVDVPYGKFDPDLAPSEDGLGDISLGFDLKAYEHVFCFPYVIPHATVKFDTGEEKALLGDNQSSVVLGTTVGSTVYDYPVHVAGDISYEIFEDSENILALAASVVWDISEQFSILAEVRLTDEELPAPFEEHPIQYAGGMVYKATDTLTLAVYGAAGKNSREDVSTTFRVVKDF